MNKKDFLFIIDQLKKRIVSVPPENEATFVAGIFKRQYNEDIDPKRVVLSGYTYKYSVFIGLLVFFSSVFLSAFVFNSIIMIIAVVILFLCSLPFWGGKEYICYDDLKIADVREKGTFDITYIRRDIIFRELVRVKIRTRNYNRTSVRNYDFYSRYGEKLRFQLSFDRHYHFMVNFEGHLEKIASGHGFEFDRKRVLVFS